MTTRPMGAWFAAGVVVLAGCGDGVVDAVTEDAAEIQTATDAALLDQGVADAPLVATDQSVADQSVAETGPVEVTAEVAAEVAPSACAKDSDCTDDDNLCNGVPYCDLATGTGICKPNFKTVIECPPSANACAQNLCDPKTGQCATAPVVGVQGKAVYCEDGNPCTANDTCVNGACTAGEPICKCLQTSDCKDDGDLCNGVPYCDKAAFPFLCKTNLATVVTCPTGLDTACEKHVCQPASGTCAVVLAADGSQCNDDDPCTDKDFCAGGQCKAGVNVCPCATTADCKPHEDGNFCNGTLYCDLSAAIPGCKVNPATVVTCPDGDDTVCQHNKCDAKDGKCKFVASPATTVCDDNNVCTSGDLCKDGACQSGANTCKCTQDSECAQYENGDLCDGTLFCDKGKQPFVCVVNPKTVVKCSDGNDTACSVNTCDKKAGKCGMVALPNGITCDADDFACTQGDSCKGGLCLPGANVCACESGPDCAKHEDGNVCNGTLYCDKAKQPFVCQVNPATLVVCPSVDDTECLHNKCQPISGACQVTPVNQG